MFEFGDSSGTRPAKVVGILELPGPIQSNQSCRPQIEQWTLLGLCNATTTPLGLNPNTVQGSISWVKALPNNIAYLLVQRQSWPTSVTHRRTTTISMIQKWMANDRRYYELGFPSLVLFCVQLEQYLPLGKQEEEQWELYWKGAEISIQRTNIGSNGQSL